jgi:hypothetical protein
MPRNDELIPLLPVREFFDRVCKVTVKPPDSRLGFPNYVELASFETTIENLRMTFNSKASYLASQPTTLDLRIYNLKAETRAKLQGFGSTITLEAGYVDNHAVVFHGNARNIDHAREGPDWVTRITCGDGEIAMRYDRVNESLGPNTSMKEALLKIVESMKLDAKKAIATIKAGGFTDGVGAFLNGVVLNGNAMDTLNKYLGVSGYEARVNKGELVIKRKGEASKKEPYVLSPSSGLIGSPDHGAPKGPAQPAFLRVKSLLLPNIEPDDKFQLKGISDDKNVGTYIVKQVKHVGDTHGQEWYSEIDAEKVT